MGHSDAVPPQVIICAGINRSGSTWLFNALRLVLSTRGECYACWVGDYAFADPRRVHLIKVHEKADLLAEKASFIFTSRRDLRDVAASALRMGWASTDEDARLIARVARERHDYWVARSSYELVYEEMIGNQPAAVEQIARVLRVQIDRCIAYRLATEVDQLPEATQRHDVVSLLHPKHRGAGTPGGWKVSLSAGLATKIVDDHHDWFLKWGYQIA